MQIRKHIQGAFRSIPSSTPIKSPSPDNKNCTSIAPTLTPDYFQLTHHLTPPKLSQNKHQMHNAILQGSETKKYSSQQVRDRELKEISTIDINNSLNKDEIIIELKKVINIMKMKPKDKEESVGNKQLTNQIKILTIENQKLLTMIDKLRLKNTSQNNIESIKQELSQAQTVLMKNELNHQKQIDNLLRSHKSLAQHCKQLQTQLKIVEKQNDKLIQMLKEKDESQRKMYLQKMDFKSDSDITKGQKLSITKIKQQYQENINLLKQNFQQQVNTIMENYNEVIQDLHSKIKAIQKHIQNMQQFKMGQTKKSQIYIEEGPSSSSSSKARNDLSQIQEEKREQSNLEVELSNTRRQLEEIRFKYDKICLDTSTTAYSKRPQSYEDLQSHKAIIQAKNRQILSLKQQILFLTDKRADNDNKIVEQINKLKETQVEQLRKQTQQKVTQLINIHQQELDIIKHQLNVKNNMIKEINANNLKKQVQIEQQITNLRNFGCHLEEQYKVQRNELQEKAIKNQIMYNECNEKMNNYKLQLVNIKQIHLSQINLVKLQNIGLKKEIQNLNNIKDDLNRINYELSVQINQHIEQNNNLEYMKNIIDFKNQQISNLLEKQKENQYQNSLLRQKLQGSKNQMSQLVNKMQKLRDSNIIKQLIQIKQLADLQQFLKTNRELSHVSELYQKSSLFLQQKINQSNKLTKENLLWSEKYLKSEENRVSLQEKLRYMEGVVEIYTKQIDDRRKLCERLIEQRTTVEKQFIMSKSQQIISAQSTIKSATTFFEKIDQMIYLEQQRLRQFDNFMEYQSEGNKEINK